MKFKAFLTDNGVNLLEKRFLPALDKMGRICHLYLTRDHTIFLHNLLNGDGIQSIAQFRKEALFDDYRISSQNDDRIAFTIDLSLLHRALRSSVSIYTEVSGNFGGGTTVNRLQIKLVKKLPPNCNQPMPFLTFESKGYKSAVIQDVPISKPLSRADVLELQSALDMAQDMPRTLVQVPDMNQLQNFMDRMKHVGDLLNVSISKYGDLHVQISTTLITLGAEFRKLLVIGEQAEVPASDRNLSAQSRSERAMQRGDAQSVQVSMKHFAKSLQCHLAKPDCAFYGIAPQGACLTVIFQFYIPGVLSRRRAYHNSGSVTSTALIMVLLNVGDKMLSFGPQNSIETQLHQRCKRKGQKQRSGLGHSSVATISPVILFSKGLCIVPILAYALEETSQRA